MIGIKSAHKSVGLYSSCSSCALFIYNLFDINSVYVNDIL